MKDMATDFKANVRIDVNDVLDDIREDIMMNVDDIDDLREAMSQLNDEMTACMETINDTNKMVEVFRRDVQRMTINHSEFVNNLSAMIEELRKNQTCSK